VLGTRFYISVFVAWLVVLDEKHWKIAGFPCFDGFDYCIDNLKVH
jgi:hypothetical protein